jgi:hypothetical protein
MLIESNVIISNEPSSNFYSINHNYSLCTVIPFKSFIPVLLSIKYEDYCHAATDCIVIDLMFIYPFQVNEGEEIAVL